MADEMEWQPVRLIAGPRHFNGPGLFIKNGDAIHGCILRVRPVGRGLDMGFTCDGLILEMHPEDAIQILGHYGRGRAVICEHRIQAD